MLATLLDLELLAALTPGAAPPFCVPAFFGDPTPTSTVTSSSDSTSWYTSTAQSGPLLLMKNSHPILDFKPLILLLPTLYLLPLHPHHCFFFPFLTLSRFFNGMLGVSKPGALNYYTLFRLILLTLFVSRNLTLIYLLLSGSLDDLIAPISGVAFFSIDVTDTSGGVIIFVRQGLSFSELSTSSLSSLDPYSDYVEVNISKRLLLALIS